LEENIFHKGRRLKKMNLKMSFWKKIQRKIMQLYTGNPGAFSHRPRHLLISGGNNVHDVVIHNN